MSAHSMLMSLPGVYYYQTRYARRYQRVIHVLKYWLPYAIVLWFLGCRSERRFGALALVGLAFLNLYDVFCRENDRWATAREALPVRREWRPDVPTRTFLTWKGVTECLLLLLLAVSVSGGEWALSVAVLLGMAGCFALHNRLREPWRPVTHYLLYVSKGLALLPVAAACLASGGVVAYVLFTLLFNMAYFPNYMARKTGGRTRAQLAVSVIGPVKHVLLMPLFYKNVFLLALGVWDRWWWWILCWIDACTIVEYAMGRLGRVGRGGDDLSGCELQGEE